MITARNAITAHAKDFLLNDELLLSILSAFARTLHWLTATLLEMLDAFSLCVLVERSVAPANSSPPYSHQTPEPRQTRPIHTAGIIS